MFVCLLFAYRIRNNGFIHAMFDHIPTLCYKPSYVVWRSRTSGVHTYGKCATAKNAFAITTFSSRHKWYVWKSWLILRVRSTRRVYFANNEQTHKAEKNEYYTQLGLPIRDACLFISCNINTRTRSNRIGLLFEFQHFEFNLHPHWYQKP